MADPTEPDWSSVRNAFRPTAEELAEYARLTRTQAADAEAGVRGLMEEARRRLHTEPVFHARVTQAARVGLRGIRAEDPDDARRWLRLGAALALVLELREPAVTDHQEPPT